MCAILATVSFVITLFCLGVEAPTGEVLYRLAPNLLGGAQLVVSRHIDPALWDAIAASVLSRPAWIVPGSFGVLFTICAIVPSLRRRADPSPRLSRSSP